MHITAPTIKYPIGTKYTLKRPKYTRECEVVDHLITFNSKGECVALRYVVAHTTLGQQVLDRDVLQTTIDRALALS